MCFHSIRELPPRPGEFFVGVDPRKKENGPPHSVYVCATQCVRKNFAHSYREPRNSQPFAIFFLRVSVRFAAVFRAYTHTTGPRSSRTGLFAKMDLTLMGSSFVRGGSVEEHVRVFLPIIPLFHVSETYSRTNTASVRTHTDVAVTQPQIGINHHHPAASSNTFSSETRKKSRGVNDLKSLMTFAYAVFWPEIPSLSTQIALQNIHNVNSSHFQPI